MKGFAVLLGGVVMLGIINACSTAGPSARSQSDCDSAVAYNKGYKRARDDSFSSRNDDYAGPCKQYGLSNREIHQVNEAYQRGFQNGAKADKNAWVDNNNDML